MTLLQMGNDKFAFKETVRARAKINIGLDILGRRTDGYHTLATCMHPISICDELSIHILKKEPNTEVCLFDRLIQKIDSIHIYLSEQTFQWHESLQLDPNQNIITRTITLYFKALYQSYPSLKGQIWIAYHLKKHIPIQAGLGGGSADAAAALKILDQWLIETEAVSLFDTVDPYVLSLQLGADVPFCFYDFPAYCTGLGEVIEPIQPIHGLWGALIQPPVFISTALAFKKWDHKHLEMNGQASTFMNSVRSALNGSDYSSLKNMTRNVFYDLMVDELPIFKEIMVQAYQAGACLVQLSGSGSAMYALFEELVMRDQFVDQVQSHGSYSVVQPFSLEPYDKSCIRTAI